LSVCLSVHAATFLNSIFTKILHFSSKQRQVNLKMWANLRFTGDLRFTKWPRFRPLLQSYKAYLNLNTVSYRVQTHCKLHKFAKSQAKFLLIIVFIWKYVQELKQHILYFPYACEHESSILLLVLHRVVDKIVPNPCTV
jgi:hypothetical protein